MPTDQDRHMPTDAASDRFPNEIRRRAFATDDEGDAELRAFLVRNSGERAARYVPLPRLIQE